MHEATFRHRLRAGCLLSRCCAAMLPAPTHGGAMMTRLPSPTPPCHRRHTDGLRRTQKSRADLLTVIPRYLLLRHVGDSSSGRATWRCGGRRVELENLSGAHGGNDKPAPVQSPNRGAARQASKRANQYLSVSTGSTNQLSNRLDSPGAAERVCSGTAQLGKHSSGLATMTTRHLQLRWSANGGNALAA